MFVSVLLAVGFGWVAVRVGRWRQPHRPRALALAERVEHDRRHAVLGCASLDHCDAHDVSQPPRMSRENPGYLAMQRALGSTPRPPPTGSPGPGIARLG